MGFSWDDLRPFKGVNDFVDAAKANDAKTSAAKGSTPSANQTWRKQNADNHKKAGNPLNIRKSS